MTDNDVVERVLAALEPYLHDMLTPQSRREAPQAALSALQPGDQPVEGLVVSTLEMTGAETAARKAAEEMREAAAAFHDNRADSLIAKRDSGNYDPMLLDVLVNEHRVSATAIRALPLLGDER